MFRKPVFWMAFGILSAGAAIFAAANFSKAFPIVSLDVRMDRDAALVAARDLALRFGWPPEDYDQAVAFNGNPEVQNFIELEGGGKEELARVLSGDLFSPYIWEVRHYRESNEQETRIRFTPEGQPYGFSIKLPEAEAGPAIEREQAREIAERSASDSWKVDLAPYSLVESSQEDRPGGRRDHTFVYERQDARLREGRYRLRLVVGGDRLTELTNFVQVPQAFSRRYQEMRSSNDTIGAFASVAMVVVYILGCCGIGLFFLMRHHWVMWRQAALWALVVGLLFSADVFNAWPRLWMTYDTALSASGFAIQQIAFALATFAVMVALLGVSFMTAESLSRRAFPRHVQLWKVWSTPVANSKPVVGQLVGGYLLVTVFFAYEVVLYAFGHGRLGWWTPSDMLINPDLFGSYLPALTAVANSLQAGFWEECLFRAVPLASAALIGDKLGARRTLIVIVMVAQALIFGAGHAGYATQPAYARVVELIIPSMMFGAVYLAFGLLPGIILHYAFDLVWFSMPIFMSSAPRARLDQALVVLLGLAPLGIALLARARAGKWTEAPEDARNGAWSPPVVPAAPASVEIPPVPTVIAPLVVRLLPIAGAIGVVGWLTFSILGSDTPSLFVSRSEAERSAREALSERGVQLDASWRVLSRTEAAPGEPHRFVWQTAGREPYERLLGTYLPSPHWIVRFARFEGDVAARAEEYQVSVGDGGLWRVRHVLAEDTPRKQLLEQDARSIARAAALDRFQIPIDSFRQVSAESQKRPARLDWTFQFADGRDYGLRQGQTRVSVVIAGDQLSDVNRFVFVPEEWTRRERARQNLPTVITIVCAGLLAVLAGAGVIRAVVSWARRRGFSIGSFAAVGAALLVLTSVNLFNNWPVVVSQVSTAQPFLLQVIVILAVNLVASLFIAISLGLAAGFIMRKTRHEAGAGMRQSLLLGCSLGALIAGLQAAGNALVGPDHPEWPGFQGVAAWSPFLAALIDPVSSFLIQTLVLAILLQHIDWLSSLWRRRKKLSFVLLVAIGLILAGSGIETLSAWIVSGLAGGLLLAGSYILALRHAFAILPAAVGTAVILDALAAGAAQSYPAALPGAIAGAVLTSVVAGSAIFLRYRS